MTTECAHGATTLDEYIERLVDAAPALTAEQRTTLHRVLASPARRDEATHARAS